MDFSSQRGQIILIVILAMVVGLTIGLAVISRSITSLRSSTDEKNSQAALTAAEAGIEQAAKSADASKITFSNSLGNESSYKTDIKFQTGTDFLMQDGKSISKNEGGDIWLINHNVDGTPSYATLWNGNLTIAFGTNANVCDDPALEVIVLSGPVGSPKTTRSVYDPCPSRAADNKFAGTSGSLTINSLKFNNSVTISGISNGIVARVVPLYKSGQIGFRGAGLPSQGKIYESVGSSLETKRKVVVFENWPTLPIEIFQYTLLVPGP